MQNDTNKELSKENNKEPNKDFKLYKVNTSKLSPEECQALDGMSEDTIGYWTLRYMPFIKKHVQSIWRKMGATASLDDMMQTAFLESLKAERTYDKDKTVFNRYVIKFITGGALREATERMYRYKKILMKVANHTEKHYKCTGKILTTDTAISQLGISKDTYDSAILATKYKEHLVDDDMVVDDVTEYNDLYDAIAKLNRKEKVIAEKYLDGRVVDAEALARVTNKLRKIIKEQI